MRPILAPFAAAAFLGATAPASSAPAPGELALLAAAGLDGDSPRQRQDVREVSLPPQPTGPASPLPFCGPAVPDC